MAKARDSLTWNDIDDLAFRLIDLYPQTDPSQLSDTIIIELVDRIPEFDSSNDDPDTETLEELKDRWYEERSDMDDELGPLAEESQLDLDEDRYRSDRSVEEVNRTEEDFEEEPLADEDDFEEEI